MSTAKINPARFVHVSAEAPSSQCPVPPLDLAFGHRRRATAPLAEWGAENMFLVSVDFGIIVF
jgi:hypothetical protein